MKIAYIIAATLFIAGCSSQQETQEPVAEEIADEITLTEEQYKNANIEVGQPEWKALNAVLNVNGLVDVPPQNIVSISFPLGGYLKSTRLLPGMHVNKGEVIARIEDQTLIQLQQDYLVEKNRLEFLEKDYQRQQTLNISNVNSEKTLQQSKADYFSQKVRVKGYDEKLRLIGIQPDKLNEENISRSVAIYSPIDGFVSKVNVNIGKYVNPSDVLFELINPDDIHAALTVFEKDLDKVKPKQKVMVSFVDEPGIEYECEVLLVTKNVDDNRSALVHCHFEKQPKHLLPGMFLNASIYISNNLSLTVPEDAVVRYGESHYVLVQKGNLQYKLQKVDTGITENNFVEIRSDETDLTSQKVITRNAYAVLSKMKNISDEE